MFLSKLEIQGFKSFAEKTVLQFNRELTAIVGPNGSGKSNVADAIRWVLGEQSLKTLRGKKAEDIIFSGTALKPRMGFAEVSLALDNLDGRAALDYREIVITRRLYRDGESEYLINKNKVRLLDIQLMLAKASFGQRTYSIIGQGMIDSILLASPIERKEFFDEATGVRSFQLKKEQAKGKLEASRVNLIQTRSLIAEIEPRLRSLTRQVKRLERKDEVELELKNWQIKYYGRLMADLAEKIGNYQNDFAKIEKEKKGAYQKSEQLRAELEANALKDTASESFQKLQAQAGLLTSEKNQLERELSLVKGKMELKLVSSGQTNLVWLNNRLEEAERKLKESTILEETQSKESGKISELLAIKEQDNAALNKEIADIQASLKNFSQKLLPRESASAKIIGQKLHNLYLRQKSFLENLEESWKNINWQTVKKEAAEITEEMEALVNLSGEAENQEEIRQFNVLQEQLNQALFKKEKLAIELNELKIKQSLAEQQTGQSRQRNNELDDEKNRLEKEIKTAGKGKDEASSEHAENKKQLEENLRALEAKQKEINRQLDGFSGEQKKQREEFNRLQQDLRKEQENHNRLEADLGNVKIELARLETKKEALENEIAWEIKGGFKPEQTHGELNIAQAQSEISRLKNQLAIIGAIDEESIKEYEEVKSRHYFLSEQITDLESAINSCEQIIEELDKKISGQFESAFEKINDKFQAYFKILFSGGQARLSLNKKEIIENENGETGLNGSAQAGLPAGAEEKTPESESNLRNKKRYEVGIEIEATPPGKRLKSLTALSGGEKALTSIALISAIVANNPSPFVVLDEVDAALDEANSERFAKIVAELSDRTQFICITHNRATMHQAAILYGVTMGANGVSKLLSVNLAEAEKAAE